MSLRAAEPSADPQRAARRVFGIDLRSLAAMRIGLGVLLLIDLVGRAPFLSAHYSDQGILPREALSHFSLHSFGGSASWAGLLFAAAAVFAGMLLIGYRTWLATLASWVLLTSLHLRNPLVIDSGDKLLALLLFWGMFLPLGARCSLDARCAGAASKPRGAVLSAASAALLLQVAFVYVFTALLKDMSDWLVEGSAAYYALNLDMATTPFGRSLLQFPGLLRLASRSTFVLEFVVPFLAFVPRGTSVLRTLLPAVFIAFHLSLSLCLTVGLFPYVCSVAWLPFLPPEIWDRASRSPIVKALARLAGPAARRAAAAPFDPARVTGVNLAAGAALAFVFVWNLGTVSPALEMPWPLKWAGEQLCLRQRWSMFGSILRADGWWVMPARLRDGSEVDLHTGHSPVSRDKPEPVSATFPSHRVWKCLSLIWVEAEHRDKIRHYAAGLRNEWDARHEASRHVETMQVHYMLEETRPDYLPPLRAAVLIYEWNGPGNERVVKNEGR